LGTNNLAGEIKKAFGSAESSGGSAGKSAGGGFLKGVGGILTAAAGAVAVGSFVKGAISGAADLEQSVGAVDAVFKGSAGQIHDWAKTAATDVGLTQNEFNTLGSLIGSQLKNGGTAMDELGPKTKDLIQTGADLSSMFGGTTQDAVAALSSALKGERDPIEAYGVSLNQAKIDAEAAALGFKKVGGTLSSEANQAATLSLIMKQTADAHGNFAKEADTLSHKQQVLNAQWQDGKAAIGSALLPAVSAVTGALSKALGPAMAGALAGTKEVVGGFTAMGAAFKAGGSDVTSSGFAGVMERIGLVARQAFDGIAPVVSSLAASFGPLIPQVFSLLSAFSPLGLVFKAIQPILPQLLTLFAQLGQAIAGTLSTTLTALMPVVTMFVEQLSQMAIGIMPAVSQIVTLLGSALGTLAPVIAGIIAHLAPLIMSLMSQLAPIIINLVTSILPPLVSIFGDIIAAIAPLVAMIMGLLIPIIQALMPVVVTVFGVIASVITSAMQIIQGIIQVVTGIITGNWSQVWNGLGNIVSGALATVGAVLVGLKDIVLSALGGIGGWLVDSGRALIQGFIDGIGGMVGAIGDAVGGVLGAVADFFPHSPAKKGPFSGRGYTTYSGAALAGDFATSIEGQRSRVAAAAASVTGAAVLSGSMVPAGAVTGGASAPSGGASGAGVNVNIHPAPGMSEETIGRVAANSLNYQLRMA